MNISDPLFREAVDAIDAGDVPALERLLAAHPELARDPIDVDEEGYFRRPYLLWFVCENPVRTGRMPKNVREVASAIIDVVRREAAGTLGEQLDYALGLVSSGRIAREQGAQRDLIDLFVDAGANPECLLAALAHQELGAAERLLERGATLTLPAAVCLGRDADVARLAPAASVLDKQIAFAAAALHGLAPMLALLLQHGVELDAFGPPGFHPHATAVHHAVSSGSLAAVKVLVEAGARLDTRDRVYSSTPLDWAVYARHPEIAAYLRERG